MDIINTDARAFRYVSKFTEYGRLYILCDDNNKQEEIIMEEKKIVPGMMTCDVCGRDFPLVAERRYTAESGLCSMGAVYDAIDCPHCGCQNVLQLRYRAVNKEDK